MLLQSSDKAPSKLRRRLEPSTAKGRESANISDGEYGAQPRQRRCWRLMDLRIIRYDTVHLCSTRTRN